MNSGLNPGRQTFGGKYQGVFSQFLGAKCAKYLLRFYVPNLKNLAILFFPPLNVNFEISMPNLQFWISLFDAHAQTRKMVSYKCTWQNDVRSKVHLELGLLEYQNLQTSFESLQKKGWLNWLILSGHRMSLRSFLLVAHKTFSHNTHFHGSLFEST